MSLGTLTLACLLLSTNAELPEIWHLPDRRFSIPIRIQPSRQKEIRELLLYASRDEGKTWELVARTTPDQTSFPFVAPVDGPYWFKVAIVNNKGEQEPRDIMQAAVGQRLIVDTIKPNVQFTSVTRQGNTVAIKWTTQEVYPDPTTLIVEYRTPESVPGMWTPVPGVTPQSKEVSFAPGTDAPLSFRLTMKDQAGNVGEATYELPGLGGVAAPTQTNPLVSGHMAQPLPGAESMLSPMPQPSLPPPATTPGVGATSMSPALPSYPTSLPPQPSPETTAPSWPSPNPVQPVASSDSHVGTNQLGTSPVSNAGYSPNNTQPRPMLPRKIINQLQAKLDFEVTDYGPSGLGGVDIYLTIDGGRSWELAKENAAPEYPPLGDMQVKQPVIGSVTLALPREGVTYGVYLVVKSRAGLGVEAPRPGDGPQMLIEVDTQMPVAELFQPEADPGREDALLLRWDARDRKFGTNPITIEWSESPQGPWNFIGGPEHPNSKQYSWQLPRDIPPQAYLKLTVRDAAGNIAVAQTPKPVLLDIKRPKARIIGLTTP